MAAKTGSKAKNIVVEPSGKCWVGFNEVSGGLLEALKAEPFVGARQKGPKAVQELLASLRRETVAQPAVFIGAGTCGLGAGAAKTIAAVKKFLEERRIKADVIEVGCNGMCSDEPIVDIQMPGRARVSFGPVTEDKAAGLLEAVLVDGAVPGGLVLGQYAVKGAQPWDGVPLLEDHPFLKNQVRVVLGASGIINPRDINEYIARGGYSAIAKVLATMKPEDVCAAVEKSGLRGRGGGGFLTGLKWKFARASVADQKYLICNADEGDPGAFMDRAVCESDPHRLLEGMLIAAYAIGATKAYIYIRAEYPLAIKHLNEAFAQARACGLIGENVLGSGFDFEIKLKMGAGAFVCGEETALIHSIEGKRGMPRPRPPFPAASGLFGKPTIINNVETLSNLPVILDRGAEWYAAMGTAGSKGTKVFALSGMVRRTGLVEIPMGTPLREVVYDIGGGIPNNKKCKAVQIGGPSGGCVPAAHLDIQTDYEKLKAFGTIMGSGGLVVVDESTCMVDFAKYFMEFIQSESCGKCIPCREGTRRMLEILTSLTRPRHKEAGIDPLLRVQGIMRLQELGEMIRSTSLCGLGQSAPNPVLSTLKWFRDEYEAHLYERRCPAGSCKELTGAPCQSGCPVGTEAWRYVALVGRGEYAEAYKVIRDANPFPSACARVCNHPCEKVCRAGATGGEPIAIRSLKRFVVDSAEPPAPAAVSANKDAARVAVVGAGPAGLAAANALSLKGHRVTVFEREQKAGGMLAAAIPAYRLPKDILEKEIASLLNDNLKIEYGKALGKDFTVDALLKDGYKAVFVATGSQASKKLDLEGEDAEGIMPGIKFLKAWNLRGENLAKGRVGVVGGGNSAMDAARVALRQPGVDSVTVFYRRTRESMPAFEEEIEAGIEEGITLETLATPVAVGRKDGKLASLTLLRNELGAPDASGRRTPVPIKGSEFEVPLDTLIVAISEEPETAGMDGVALSKWGTVEVSPESLATNVAGVFAGGDVVTGPSTVIGGVAAGKKAAVMIDRYLSGKLMRELPKVVLPTVYVAPVATGDGDGGEEGEVFRLKLPVLTAAQRKGGFAEVELTPDEAGAKAEALRCARCDLEFTQPR
ncbi:MAG: FAD-dependent oxidoreductase [Acidobacteriota bacterium]|jgi:NADH-quinone oxidoreductase subunit F|nr:FAD-dependent oxidoreductase [Acidobacteriota bacterium]